MSVLVYAALAKHPLGQPCRALMAAVGESRIASTSAVEVPAEFARVGARFPRRGRHRRKQARVASRHRDLIAHGVHARCSVP